MSSLGHDLAAKLLQGDEFSDFTITCGSHNFPVHKVLIASKSSFLRACVSSEFRESKQQQVYIQEATPLAVASVLYYIYAGTYDLDKVIEIWPGLKPTVHISQNTTVPAKRKLDSTDDEAVAGTAPGYSKTPSMKQIELENLRCHMRLYELSDRFMMPELKDQAVAAVMDTMDHGCAGYSCGKDPCVDMRDITAIISNVRDHTTPDDIGLRQAVLSWCLANIGCLTNPISEAVEESIKASDPVLWNFGMSIAKRLKETHEFYMDTLKEAVRTKVLEEVRKLPKDKVDLNESVLDNLFEEVDETCYWDRF